MRFAGVAPTVALLACALPATARGADPGGTPTAVTAPVRVDAVICRSRCSAGGAVAPGGLVRLRGRGLDHAARVVFPGGPSAPAVRARPGQADARVPGGVTTGPVRVATADGALSPPAAGIRVSALMPHGKRGHHVTTQLDAARVAYAAAQPAQLRYTVTDPQPAD